MKTAHMRFLGAALFGISVLGLALVRSVSAFAGDTLGENTPQPSPSPSLSPSGALAEECYTLTKARRYDQAMTACKQALTLDPQNVSAYVNTANVYYYMGDYAKAAAQFIAAQRQPGVKPANGLWVGPCLDLREAGEYGAALKQCNDGLKQFPNDGYLLAARGSVKVRTGDYPGALVDLTAALTLQTAPAFAQAWRGLAFARLKRYPEALSDLNAAIDARFTDRLTAQAYATRAEVDLALGDNAKAVADYEQARTFYLADDDRKDASAISRILAKLLR